MLKITHAKNTSYLRSATNGLCCYFYSYENLSDQNIVPFVNAV